MNNNKIIQILKYLLAVTVLVTLAGCNYLMPYKEDSSCQFNDLGRCLPIDKAYEEAVTGTDQKGTKVNGEDETITQISNTSSTVQIPIDRAQITRMDATYHNIQTLVQNARTPLLRQAVVRRVLVLPYQSSDAMQWYEPRHIYYIEKQPQWLLESHEFSTPNQNQFNLFN